ncbi:Rv2732c family membrane protein [Mycolicibacter senuensis]|uniref:Rv2732c family membrane protein n=1 Tax=Mycolicibacter senuensis TaxID=386913 RepID=UPI000DCF484C|nr:hypothetical protein [Mycolicibacter senuensis]RAU95355.1 hypothetical protein DQP56_16550 [Mycolicibacter senuensis]
MSGHGGNPDDFEAYRADIEAAERRVASEIDPGGRGVVVSIAVFVLLASFLLPHTGTVRGWDVLFAANGSDEALVTLPSRLFMWLALVFGVGFSMLALMTRRWTVAWVALAGSAVASVAGLLAVWSRQTVMQGHPGPGFGLILCWITVIVLTFHWARLVWSRTAVQLAAEEERRRRTAQRQPRGLLDDIKRPDDRPPGE